jgi:hypothetical protein
MTSLSPTTLGAMLREILDTNVPWNDWLSELYWIADQLEGKHEDITTLSS